MPINLLTQKFPIPVLLLNAKGLVLDSNEIAKKKLHIKQRKVYISRLSGPLAKAVWKIAREAFADKNFINQQLTFQDGVERIQVFPIRQGDGLLMGVAIENLTELERMKNEREFLFQLSHMLTHQLPEKDLLTAIIRQLVFLTEIDEAILAYSLMPNYYRIIGNRRMTLTGEENRLLGRVFRDEQPLAIPNTAKPLRSHGIPSIEKKPRSLLVVPLMVSQRSIGALFLYQRSPSYFDNMRFIFYHQIASRLAEHIENHRLIFELTEKGQHLSALIEHSGEGVTVLNERKRISIWNQAMEELTGISRSNALGKTCEILHPLLEGASCPLESRQAGGEFQVRHTQSGELRFVAAVSSAVPTGRGKMNRLFLIRDISKTKELDAAKSDFVSLATHQLRTPLTVILGYLSMLVSEKSGSLTKDQWKYVGRIQEATTRLSALVEDLLHVVKIEEGRLKVSPGPVVISSIIQEILPDFLATAEAKELSLKASGKENIAILADTAWLKHVLINLIDNALKYTRAGGRIEVTWHEQRIDGKRMGAIEVKDTGIGIPRDAYRTIFEKFGRLAGNPIDVSGSGLGLYIAKQLVEKQGGTISVDSVHGKGSTFTIAFPLAKAGAKQRQERKV